MLTNLEFAMYTPAAQSGQRHGHHVRRSRGAHARLCDRIARIASAPSRGFSAAASDDVPTRDENPPEERYSQEYRGFARGGRALL